jgi:hypothetical protein
MLFTKRQPTTVKTTSTHSKSTVLIKTFKKRSHIFKDDICLTYTLLFILCFLPTVLQCDMAIFDDPRYILQILQCQNYCHGASHLIYLRTLYLLLFWPSSCIVRMHALFACMYCSHVCIVRMHVLFACMHCSHACIVRMHALFTCMYCSHACIVRMHALFACMHCSHACIVRMHAFHHVE